MIRDNFFLYNHHLFNKEAEEENERTKIFVFNLCHLIYFLVCFLNDKYNEKRKRKKKFHAIDEPNQ